jgi:hypothetical protein
MVGVHGRRSYSLVLSALDVGNGDWRSDMKTITSALAVR